MIESVVIMSNMDWFFNFILVFTDLDSDPIRYFILWDYNTRSEFKHEAPQVIWICIFASLFFNALVLNLCDLCFWILIVLVIKFYSTKNPSFPESCNVWVLIHFGGKSTTCVNKVVTTWSSIKIHPEKVYFLGWLGLCLFRLLLKWYLILILFLFSFGLRLS